MVAETEAAHAPPITGSDVREGALAGFTLDVAALF